MATTWQIRTFHINVKQGDSAIHALVAGQAPNHHAESLVLVDGGTTSNSEGIKEVYGKLGELGLEREHAQELGGFDAYVVTHWDRDHYGGIGDLIYESVESSALEWIKGNHPKENSEFVEAISHGLIRCKYSRYNPQGKLLARFYSPNTDYKFKEIDNAKTGNQAMFKRRVDQNTPIPYVGYWLYINYTKKKAERTYLGFVPVAICGETGEDLLGIDLFTGHRVEDHEHHEQLFASNMKSPKTICRKLYTMDLNKPAMVCIAANDVFPDQANEKQRFNMTWVHCGKGEVLQQIKLVNNVQGPWERLHWATVTLQKTHITPQIIDKNTTFTNNQSIACMIAWPHATEARISHYFAGDLGYLQEERIMRWAAIPDDETNPISDRTCVRLDFVKLSHHGSKGSIPLLMLFAWNPRVVVCSDGTHLGYNLASWETLFYIMVWTRWRQVTQGDLRARAFFTNVPGWLCRTIMALNVTHEAYFTQPLRVGDVISALERDEGEYFRELFKFLYLKRVSWSLDEIENLNNTEDALDKAAIICLLLHDNWEAFAATRKDQSGLNMSIRQMTESRSDILCGSQDLKVIQHIFSPVGIDVLVYPKQFLGTISAHNFYHWEDPQTHFYSQTRLATATVNDKTSSKILSGNRRKRLMGGYSSTAAINVRILGSEYSLSEKPPMVSTAVTTSQQDFLTPPALLTVDSPYYFMSSDASFKDRNDKSPFGRPPKLKPLDLFLGRLETGSLVLNSPPGGAGSSALHESDELRSWFIKTLEGSDTAAFNLTASFKDNLIAMFELKTSLGAVFKSPFKSSFTFSYSDNIRAFKITQNSSTIWPAVDPKSPDIAGSPQTLCLSLDPTSAAYNSGFTAAQVYDLLGFKSDWADKIFANQIGLKLDNLEGARNALWFTPDLKHTATLRLCFVLSKDAETNDLQKTVTNMFQEWLSKNTLPFSILNFRIITKRTWTGTLNTASVSSTRLSLTFRVKMNDPNSNAAFNTALSFGASYTAWVLYDSGTDKDLGNSALQFITKLFGLEDLGSDISKLVHKIPGLGDMKIRRVLYIKQEKIWTVKITVQVILGTMPLQCTFEFGDKQTPKWSFYGSLFGENRPGEGGLGSGYSYLPYFSDYEDWNSIEFIQVGDAKQGADTADLSYIYGQLNLSAKATLSVDSPFDYRLIDLNFSLSSEQVSFGATIMAHKPPQSKAVDFEAPVISLAAGTLGLSYSITNSKFEKLSIETAIELKSPRNEDIVYLTGAVTFESKGADFRQECPIAAALAEDTEECDYVVVNKEDTSTAVADSVWVFRGSISKLRGSFIYSLCDNDCNYEMMQLLEHTLLNLSIEYTYEGKVGKSFHIRGSLYLGDINLLCDYTHFGLVGGKSSWKFSASLQLDRQKSSLLGIVESVCGRTLANTLPDCVKNIEVAPRDPKEFTSVELVRAGDSLLLYARIRLASDASLVLYQVQKKQSRQAMDTNVSTTKRVISFKLDKLPKIENIPVLGSLPFNPTVTFSFVSSGNKDDEGFTVEELNQLNSNLPAGYDKISFKQPEQQQQTQGSQKQPSEVEAEAVKPVLASGFHFMVMNGETVILDRVIGRAKPNGDVIIFDDNTTSSSNDLVPYKKQFGPITMTAIGLKFDYSQEKLVFLVDGSVQLGPLEFSLAGFGVSFGFKNTTLRNIDPSKLEIAFMLGGLDLSFVKSPIVLAGYLQHSTTEKSEVFEGGAALGFDPWVFQAGGYYSEPKKAGKNLITNDDVVDCFMAYANLSGPIATIGYAEIREVSGGLGYNTALTLPNMENIMDFPFIADPPKNPASAIATLSGRWMTVKENSNWVAVGMTVLAFQMLTVRTIIVAEWDRSIKLGIFGIATAEIPKQLDENKERFAMVQLGVAATVDLGVGVLKVDGQLTPASFILSRSCHLTGGFALYSWYGAGNEENQGDWIFTIGGYHTTFQPKPQYPRPPRLGISWSYDSAINISGEAYFAITPKVCMAGGRLHLSLTLGPLYAYFDAYADLLINYKPFYFIARGGISVGVRFTLNLWLVSLPIAIDLGASLLLEGNPMSETVHVDFWVFGFDINFGSPVHRQRTISGDEFWKLALQGSVGSQALGLGHALVEDDLHTEETEPECHIFACTGGMIPKAGSSSKDPWFVKASAFRFTVAFKFPIKSGKLGVKQANGYIQTQAIISSDAGKMYAKPMRLRNEIQNSYADITVERQTKSTEEHLEHTGEVQWAEHTTLYSSLPVGLWGQYEEKTDPNEGAGNEDASLLNGADTGTVRLATGVALKAPKSTHSDDHLPAFDPQEVMTEPIGRGACSIPANPTKAWEPLLKDKAQYEEVKVTWLQQSKVALDVVHLWENLKCFGWAPKQSNVPYLQGGCPEKLVKSLDQYLTASPAMSSA